MQSGDSLLQITKADLEPYRKITNSVLESARRPADVKEKGLPDELSLLQSAHHISGDAHLIEQKVSLVLHAFRTGAEMGSHVAELYAKASQLSALRERNKTSSLREDEQSAFRSKQYVAGLITGFVTAHYIAWTLSQDEQGAKASPIDVSVAGIGFANPLQGTEGIAYFLSLCLAEGSVGDAIARATAIAKKVMADIALRAETLEDAESFVSKSYKLENAEFVIDGFTTSQNGKVAHIEFNRLSFDKIVGNHAAKRKARQLAMRLACYDPKEKRNPFMMLGGISNIRLGQGFPGTGKSMLISATATELSEICAIIGTPFSFNPLPDSIVSTFQGGSAERMEKWMRPLRNGDSIIYAPIDDAENVLEERTRQGVSAGVREVIAVFLRNTEGAYATNYGNWAIDIMTNIPEQIDKAVLSRIVDRFPINGATKDVDFIDQMFLWWKKYEEMSPGFVNLAKPKGHEFLATQVLIGNRDEAYGGLEHPTNTVALGAFEKARKKCKPTDHGFYGALGTEVQKIFPFFSSRDLRNIQAAVSERISDFDFPDEWREKPDTFFRKGHDEKKDMLVGLMKKNMEGLSFGDVLLSEASRYLDTLMEISNKDFERKVKDLILSREVQEEAVRRTKK